LKGHPRDMGNCLSDDRARCALPDEGIGTGAKKCILTGHWRLGMTRLRFKRWGDDKEGDWQRVDEIVALIISYYLE
jgi:hypothetical protein